MKLLAIALLQAAVFPSAATLSVTSLDHALIDIEPKVPSPSFLQISGPDAAEASNRTKWNAPRRKKRKERKRENRIKKKATRWYDTQEDESDLDDTQEDDDVVTAPLPIRLSIISPIPIPRSAEPSKVAAQAAAKVKAQAAGIMDSEERAVTGQIAEKEAEAKNKLDTTERQLHESVDHVELETKERVSVVETQAKGKVGELEVQRKQALASLDADAKSKLATHAKTIQEAMANAAKANSEIATLQKHNNELQMASKANENKVTSLKGKLRASTEQLFNNTLKLKQEGEQQVSKLAKEISEVSKLAKDSESSLRAKASKLKGELQVLNAALAKKDTDLASLKQEVAHLTSEIEAERDETKEKIEKIMGDHPYLSPPGTHHSW